MTLGFREFEFDLPKALLDHLVWTIDEMESAALGLQELSNIPEAQGIYQLFLDGQLAYIGKTDAEAGLHRRLSRHYRKTLHRVGLSSDRVSFKAVRIFVFTAIDLETQLIKHYTGKDGTPWNGSGFGANDPGRERDTSKPGRFDQEFPIDLDVPLDLQFNEKMKASEALAKLKAALPYTLRYQAAAPRSRSPHPDLTGTIVQLTDDLMTSREALTQITKQLPSGWQATALSALLILYSEKIDNYPGAEIIARSKS